MLVRGAQLWNVELSPFIPSTHQSLSTSDASKLTALQLTVMRAAAGVAARPGSNDIQRVQHARKEAEKRQHNVDYEVAAAAGAQADAAGRKADREPASNTHVYRIADWSSQEVAACSGTNTGGHGDGMASGPLLTGCSSSRGTTSWPAVRTPRRLHQTLPGPAALQWVGG